MANQTVKFKISNEEFSKFLGLVDELNKISETHKFVWDDKGIFVYSIEGENDKINLLKTFYISRDKLFSNMPSDLNLEYTMYNTKMFVKRYKFITMSEDSDYDVLFNYIGDEDLSTVITFEASNSDLEIRSVASDGNIKALTLDVKKQLMDKTMTNAKFEVSVEDLDKIKKISKLEPDSETLDIKIEDGVVIFSESQWELKVKTDLDCQDTFCTFKKTYLHAIVPAKDVVEFCMFETYILVDEHKSQILYTLELTN